MSPRTTMRIDPADPQPIWSQIEEAVRHRVATGALAPGAGVPSVRDLARELGVNPATVSKAYQRLTEAGVLEVRRGDGTYVAEGPPALRKAERLRLLRAAAARYAATAISLGAGEEETVEAAGRAWGELRNGRREE